MRSHHRANWTRSGPVPLRSHREVVEPFWNDWMQWNGYEHKWHARLCSGPLPVMRLWYKHGLMVKLAVVLKPASDYQLKLGTHHAIFVGTTIVVRRDDGRRSSNDPLTPRDGRRLNAHTTRRPATVEADNAPGRNSTFR